jgi:chemotaxis protein MotB
MAKKHKHEEHQNLEAWVISYADMVTLLFALFVVLYAIGETKLKKLKQLKKSMQFAFSFEGEGKTKEPGVHDKGQEGRGDVVKAAEILNAQSKEMKKFIEETLPEQFLEVSGKSLKIVQTDDTIAFEAPLSAYFNPGQSKLLKSNDLGAVLDRLIGASSSFTDTVRIRIESPNVVIGRERRSGAYVRSGQRCFDRLYYLQQRISNVDKIDPDQVLNEFRYAKGPVYPPGSTATEGWEDRAVLTIAFTNSAQ